MPTDVSYFKVENDNTTYAFNDSNLESALASEVVRSIAADQANATAASTAQSRADAAYTLAGTKEDAIKGGTITLSTSWTGSDPFTQTVTVSGLTVTTTSLITLQPTDAQLDALEEANIRTLRVDNNSGTLTAHARGGKTTAAMTIQCTVTEVG